MPLPAVVLTTTCSIYRPFGGALQASGVACRHVARMEHNTADFNIMVWTDYIDVDDTVDLRDGLTRAAGSNSLTYADGDEVRIPNASGSVYVVVWVEVKNRGTPRQFKRAYLLRDTAVWPGP